MVTISGGIMRTTFMCAPQVNSSNPFCAASCCAADAAPGRCSVGSELEAHHEAEAAHVADGVDRVLPCTGEQFTSTCGGVVDEPLLFDHVESGHGRRAGDRISSVRAALRSRTGALHEFLGGGDTRQRETAREALGDGDDVGSHVEVLMPEELSGPPESGLDLVEDEQDAVFVGPLPQSLEKPGVAGDVTALAQDRFDDEGRDLVRRHEGREQVVQFLQGEIGRFLLRPAVAIGRGEGSDVYTAHERREPCGETVPEVVIVAAATVRPWKPPWKTTIPGRPVAWRARRSAASTASLPELAKNSESSPSGSTVPRRSVSSSRAGASRSCTARGSASRSAAGGLDDVRVTVAGTRDADAGGEVEIPTSVGAVDVAPLGVVDGDGRCLQQAG